MKKILNFLAITLIFCACEKADINDPYCQDIDPEVSVRGKKNNGGGGGMTVTTDEASYILPLGAVSGGSVSSGGGGNNTTERGVCFSTSPAPTTDDETVSSGSGAGTFTCYLSGLDSGMTYYTRAYAIKIKNNGDISITYGPELSFTTPEFIYGDDVTDIDGNLYTTIKIGTQWWMVENLKTTKYRDGTPIPNVTDNAEWIGLSSGAYCDYENNPENSNDHGRLYNMYSSSDPLIAPIGWHVSSSADFITLREYIGGGSIAGGRMKEAGFTHWFPQNIAGDNSSGFSALGSGSRSTSGTFHGLGESSHFWSGYTSYNKWHISNDSGSLGHASGSCSPMPSCGSYGFSVRCVKD